MAERTTQSWTTVLHFVARGRHGPNATRGLIPVIEVARGEDHPHRLMVSAVARLKQFPRMNGSGVSLNADINVALAWRSTTLSSPR
jgi:hypothetical protein